MAETPHIGFDKSNSTWRNRAELSIAHGALTNSKRPSTFIDGIYPSHLISGTGCIVTDIHGKRYIDFICGLGTNLIGYANEEINRAVALQMQKGSVLSLGTPVEVECAEAVKSVVPFVDRVRFLKTGSDACSAAIRIARAYTGRPLVISDAYHGWHDSFTSLTEPANGVPKHFSILKLKDKMLKGQLGLDGHVAAVIVEPVVTEFEMEKTRAYLSMLREECSRVGALLIFDEVITGFRFPQLSVSRYLGVEPDLICMGKAIGGGLPLSVVAGKRFFMEADYFVSSTFAGDTLSLAASLKFMSLIRSKYNVENLWENGVKFMREFNEIDPKLVRLEGYPTRGIVAGDKAARDLFFQETCKAGILFGPSWFFKFSTYPYVAVCYFNL